MKIERKDIKATVKLLKEIKYNPIGQRSSIVFPINAEKTKDVDGIDLSLVDNKFGSEKMPDPCIILEVEETEKGNKTDISFGYCDLTYARKFDITTYCKIVGCRMSTKNEEILEGLDCHLVADQNILIKFNV